MVIKTLKHIQIWYEWIRNDKGRVEETNVKEKRGKARRGEVELTRWEKKESERGEEGGGV